MYQLADGDILRMESISRILIEEAFTFLAYEKDQNMANKIKINADSKWYKQCV